MRCSGCSEELRRSKEHTCKIEHRVSKSTPAPGLCSMEKIFGTEATPKSPMCLNSKCDYFDKAEKNHCTSYADLTICAEFKGCTK